MQTDYFLRDNVTGKKVEFSFMQLGSAIYILNSNGEKVGQMAVKDNLLITYRPSGEHEGLWVASPRISLEVK